MTILPNFIALNLQSTVQAFNECLLQPHSIPGSQSTSGHTSLLVFHIKPPLLPTMRIQYSHGLYWSHEYLTPLVKWDLLILLKHTEDTNCYQMCFHNLTRTSILFNKPLLHVPRVSLIQK